MNRIQAAQRAIVRAAARMTSQGVDTSELTEPVIDLQDALADLQRLKKGERLGRPATKSARQSRR
jgi:hypothetical protein